MNRFQTLCATAALSCLISLPASAEDDYTILTIGDHEVKHSDVLTIWQSVFPNGNAPDFDSVDASVKKNVLRGVVGEYLLYSKALESGIDEKPVVQQKLEAQRKKTIVDAFLDEKSASKVTPTTVKAEYDRMKEEAKGEMEARASHILVEDKETAEKLLKRLNSGSDFDDLAKEFSTDKASAVSGGDLGYFTKDKMVKEFAEAAFKLEKGKLSEPIKSDFGWHIIKLVDMRERTIKPFIEQRTAIEQKLRAQALSQYINDLVDSADVTYLDKDGNELQLTKTPDTTE